MLNLIQFGRPLVSCLTAMVLFALIAPSSQAGLIATESFVYTPTGAQIVGQGTNAGWPTAGQLWTGATSAYVEKAELTYDVDEFRFGTTYAAVTPVPEPATGLFLALALGAAAMKRRRLTHRCAHR